MPAQWYRRLALPLGVLISATAHAGPMGFKDSWMAMGDFGPNWREAWVNYALGSEADDLPGFVVLQSGPRER